MAMRMRGVKWIAGAIALGAFALTLSYWMRSPGCIAIGGTEGVSIALTQLGRGEAKLFCYHGAGGDKIRLILARGNDGAVHSVFDACHQCYAYRRGYRLSRDGLVCRVCGNRYSVDRMMVGQASCVPVSVPHKVVGGTVRISNADIRAGRALF